MSGGLIDAIGLGVVGSSLAAGVGSVWLLGYLNRYRGTLGVEWFMGALAAQTLATLGYAVAVLVFDPFWRASLEAIGWVGIAWLGPLFLGFALAYTGRGGVVRSRGFQLLFALPVGTLLLAATHPLHTLLWRAFRIDPVFGLATVQYTIQPWGYAAVALSLATAAVGVLLLLETILSYGPLYKREAIAVGISTLPPAAGFLVWLFELGPVPALNLAPVLFLPHVVLDAYAFVGSHMFETTPTTQRAAERSALSELNDPLVVVDASGRVVNANGRATAAFGPVDATGGTTVAGLVGTDLATLRETSQLTLDGPPETVYSVSYSPLTDPSGADVGGILVFYDITLERQQQQRLSVLNRILRHNLRNKLGITIGRAELLQAAVSDPDLQSHADTLVEANETLLTITQKVREFNDAHARDRYLTEKDLEAVLEDLVDDLAAEYPTAAWTVETADIDPHLETDFGILRLAVRNLLENAIVHAETAPTVTVRLDAAADSVVIEVCDTNDRIPELELETLEAAEETPLQHGQGIGLWITSWCVRSLSGELTFEYDDGNVVQVTLPRTAPEPGQAR
jgi:signal transduction histidine kinase